MFEPRDFNEERETQLAPMVECRANGEGEVFFGEDGEPEFGEATAGVDVEGLFAAEVGQTALLTREEEDRLARQIARARRKVRRVLRSIPRVTKAALADITRGLVDPEEDFREREAVAVLRYARRLLEDARLRRGLRVPKPRLVRFVRELEGSLREYRAYRDEMFRANVRLVAMFARRYRHPTLSFLDLAQEGGLGLIRAIEKYEPDRNVRFSTYAVWWIRQHVARAADNQGALIRTPVHWNQFRRRLEREQDEAVAQAIGELDPEQVERMSQAFQYVSTDHPLDEDSNRPLEGMLAGGSVEPEDYVISADLREHLLEAVEQLPPREAEIVRHRFGLDSSRTETLEEIGIRFGVSRERIRQLEARALRQLKEICAARGLDLYLQ